jgi:hypothetical protein
MTNSVRFRAGSGGKRLLYAPLSAGCAGTAVIGCALLLYFAVFVFDVGEFYVVAGTL